MILPIEHVANWRLIYQHKKSLIDKNADKENSTRTNHHFQVEDQVLISNNKANKYETPYKGPYTIIQTWTNGMAKFSMGATTDRINIRRLKPYYTYAFSWRRVIFLINYFFYRGFTHKCIIFYSGI